MGDWNTLHVFDDKKFYQVVVPILKGEGKPLEFYLDTDFGKYTLRDIKQSKNSIIDSIIKTAHQFDDKFKFFLGFPQPEPAPIYYRNFYNKNSWFHEFNSICEYIVFSECAFFNPHFKLGKNLFYSFIKAKPNTASQDFQNQIGMMNDSIFGIEGDGIKNWITNDELSLYILDFENLSSTPQGDKFNYLEEFKLFIKTFHENGYGVISCFNLRSEFYSRIDRPDNSIGKTLKKLSLKNVIQEKHSY